MNLINFSTFFYISYVQSYVNFYTQSSNTSMLTLYWMSEKGEKKMVDAFEIHTASTED